VTPARRLLEALRTAGATFTVASGRLRYRAPAGLIGAEELAALTKHKADMIGLLEEEARRPARPPGPCELCHTSTWRWHPDFPVAGAGRWLCAACVGRLVPSVRDVADTLSVAAYERLLDEARAGDPLALILVDQLREARAV